MERVEIYTEYITLGQLLKIKNIIGSGGETKVFLANYPVYINGEKDNRRGRKLYKGDKVSILSKEYIIC